MNRASELMTGPQLIMGDPYFGVLVFNGRGGYSSLSKVSGAEILAAFDVFAAWVRSGNGRASDDVSDETTALVIEAIRQGEALLGEDVQS
jgi:hypothetical protein